MADKLINCLQSQNLSEWRIQRSKSEKRGEKIVIQAKEVEGQSFIDWPFSEVEFEGDLFKMRFEKCDLSGSTIAGNVKGTHFLGCNLNRSIFDDVTFEASNLTESTFKGASLRGAFFDNLCFLNKTDFSDADLGDANLECVDLRKSCLEQANLDNAVLDNAKVYGIRAWKYRGTPRSAADLRVRSSGDTQIVVDGLDAAQMVGILHGNRQALQRTREQCVLVLARFEGQGAGAIEVIKRQIRRKNWRIPLVCDYKPPPGQDPTEHVLVLAGMSSLVIADLTEPKSTPHELAAITRAFEVPIVPIMRVTHKSESELPYSMLMDIVRHDWVLSLKTYENFEELEECFEKIREWADSQHKKLVKVKKPSIGDSAGQRLQDWVVDEID